MGILSISTILILINILASYRGIKDPAFYNRYNFRIGPILHQKDYKRIITSSFLHVSWMHLIFNMLALFFFGDSIEKSLGPLPFILIYFGSIIGGNLLSLFIHRNHVSYSSAGASGAISGVIFAAIAVIQGLSIGLFLLPIQIPGWLFGLIYVGISIYGIRSKKDNIGHDAHLGGGLAGMLLALIIFPMAIVNNIVTILIVLIPTAAFILFIIYKPGALLIDNKFFRSNQNYNLEDRYNISKKQQQIKLDELLEKIHRRGLGSLTQKEKNLLKEYSK